jgi:hypothetical protein
VFKFKKASRVTCEESLANSLLNRCDKNAMNIFKITFVISLRGSNDA